MRFIKRRFSAIHATFMSLTLCVTAVSGLSPVTAYAAIDELVTTTARGRSEAIKDVPATVAVISQDNIEALGIERVEDFVNLVPGVTIVDAAEVGDTAAFQFDAGRCLYFAPDGSRISAEGDT